MQWTETIMFGDEENELRGTRKMVYDYIQAHPGAHLREIARSLNLAIGDVQYHLYALEKMAMLCLKEEVFTNISIPTTYSTKAKRT
ncbi:MAG: winged helix-turn-helix transcriptional regulator [Thermoproteota archaeon]